MRGGVAEWSKAGAWKASERRRSVGSNPTLSAIFLCFTSGFLLEVQSRAAKARELRQARKGATVSGVFRVPRVFWASCRKSLFLFQNRMSSRRGYRDE